MVFLVKTDNTAYQALVLVWLGCGKFTPIFFLHIFSIYAKILGEKLFRTWEIPRSGSKAKDGEKERKQAGAELCQAQDKLS